MDMGALRHRAGAEEPPLQERGDEPVEADLAVEGDGLQGGPEGKGDRVILQVRADAGQVEQRRDVHLLKMRSRADAGKHEDLRAIDRACAQDDFAPGADLPERAALPILDAHGVAVLDEDASDEGIGFDLEIGARFHRIEKGAHGAVDGGRS